MNLYIVDHPIEYPQSEYGGMHIVAANSENNARTLVENHILNPGFYKRSELMLKYDVRYIGTSLEEVEQIIDSMTT